MNNKLNSEFKRSLIQNHLHIRDSAQQKAAAALERLTKSDLITLKVHTMEVLPTIALSELDWTRLNRSCVNGRSDLAHSAHLFLVLRRRR